MPACPVGHESAADDYCDQCGRKMGGAPEPSSAAGGPAGPGLSAAAQNGGHANGRASNGQANGGRAGGGQAPEGQAAAPADGETGAPPPAAPGSAGTAWRAVVTADRDYFDRVVAAGGPEAAAISFPPYCPERRFTLGTPRAGEEKQIGRRSVSRGIDPAIDLAGPPTDPGVSRLHAVLIGQADGGWAVLDPGSENGTLVNDHEIAIGLRVPLHDGDRIHLGAWTSITIRRI
jgi:FHA domain-containing protein